MPRKHREKHLAIGKVVRSLCKVKCVNQAQVPCEFLFKIIDTNAYLVVICIEPQGCSAVWELEFSRTFSAYSSPVPSAMAAYLWRGTPTNIWVQSYHLCDFAPNRDVRLSKRILQFLSTHRAVSLVCVPLYEDLRTFLLGRNQSRKFYLCYSWSLPGNSLI